MSLSTHPILFDIYVGASAWSPEELLPPVAEAGFEGLNLPYHSRFRGGGVTDGDAMARLLERLGLPVGSVYVGGPDWSTKAPGQGQVEELADAIRLAQRFGARVAGIWPGSTCDDAAELAQRRANFRANLGELVPRLLDAGLVPSFEFQREAVIPTLEVALALTDEVPGLGLCLDTHHLNNLAIPPREAVARMGERLVEVHLSSTLRGPAGQAGDTYDYAALFAALAELGYAGPLTAQYPLDGLETLAPAAAFAKDWRARTWAD